MINQVLKKVPVRQFSNKAESALSIFDIKEDEVINHRKINYVTKKEATDKIIRQRNQEIKERDAEYHAMITDPEAK